MKSGSSTDKLEDPPSVLLRLGGHYDGEHTIFYAPFKILDFFGCVIDGSTARRTVRSQIKDDTMFSPPSADQWQAYVWQPDRRRPAGVHRGVHDNQDNEKYCADEK